MLAAMAAKSNPSWYRNRTAWAALSGNRPRQSWSARCSDSSNSTACSSSSQRCITSSPYTFSRRSYRAFFRKCSRTALRGDGPQPGAEVSADIEIRQMYKSVDKDLLDKIFSLTAVVQRRSDNPQHVRLIPVHNFLVSKPYARPERAGQVHPSSDRLPFVNCLSPPVSHPQVCRTHTNVTKNLPVRHCLAAGISGPCRR